MSYVVAVLIYLNLWTTGDAALKLETTQRPDVQCSAVYIEANGGQRPAWCSVNAR